MLKIIKDYIKIIIKPDNKAELAELISIVFLVAVVLIISFRILMLMKDI